MSQAGSPTESTRERILVEALPLFAAHGYAGTSTRRIAAAAGVNVATLAYYFDGKEGLYLTVLQRLHEDLLRFLPAEMPPLGDAMFGWIAEQAWVFCRDHREHIRLVLRHVLDQGLHEEVVVSRWTDPVLSRLEGLIGAFRPDWSRARLRLFLLGVMHMLVRFSIEDPDQLKAMLGQPDDLDAEVVGWLEALLRTELGVG